MAGEKKKRREGHQNSCLYQAARLHDDMEYD